MQGFDKTLFASRLRGKRAEMFMSRAELAGATGLSEDAIVKYENPDGYTPGADKVVLLCGALRCSPNYLMGWE